jgi:hypothetical protein
MSKIEIFFFTARILQRQNRGKKSLTDDMNSTRKKSSKAP